MRNQKQNARLQQARGHLFICSTFGFCASSVLSPRTPPANPEFGQKAAFVWAANDTALHEQLSHQQPTHHQQDLQQQQQQCHQSRVLAELSVNVAVSGAVAPGSPSNSVCDASSSCCSDRMDQPPDAAMAMSDLKSSDIDDLVAEIEAGNCTARSIQIMTYRIRKLDCKEIVESSRLASSLIALLLSRDVGDDAVREELLALLPVLAEYGDALLVREMATVQFVGVVSGFLCTGRKDVQENACLLLEKLSLEEALKDCIGGSPGVMAALNGMLGDEKHPKRVKAASKTLLALCLFRDNRRRAVEVGAVASLVEMLPRARSATAEKALATLELVGTTEEGKAAIIEHALAVPVLVELMLKMSTRGMEYAAGTLCMMCSDSLAMRQAAVAHGAPTKLLLLIQSACTARAKRKASQLMKLLHPLWLQDPCNPDPGHGLLLIDHPFNFC